MSRNIISATSPRSIEQKRALFALKQIQGLPPDKKTKEFRAKVQKFPAMIQSCGLLPAVFFHESKKDDHKTIANFLKDWLFDASECQFPWPAEIDRAELLTEVLSSVSIDLYRLAGKEALSYLKWLKRAADAILPSR